MHQDCILKQEDTNNEEEECVSAAKTSALEIMLVCFFFFYKTKGRSFCFIEPSEVKGDWLDGPTGWVEWGEGMGTFTPFGRSAWAVSWGSGSLSIVMTTSVLGSGLLG